MTAPARDNLRIAVIATGGVEEPELARPVKAVREAGARTELLSIKPGQIRAVRVVHGNLVTSRQASDVPAVTREMLNLFAAAREA